ncbi:hypothetical protein M0R45_031371 [Rubus argutus]|uniref:Uncharacterized protein n=1 Tax=Rubus argutus TaxID=59490 RepID=A0AAW1WHC0_RUBAR
MQVEMEASGLGSLWRRIAEGSCGGDWREAWWLCELRELQGFDGGASFEIPNTGSDLVAVSVVLLCTSSSLDGDVDHSEARDSTAVQGNSGGAVSVIGATAWRSRRSG